ncbi:MAG: hypothetical protein JOZ69_11855 [Myxococcales bacterium]|nr:hypothetical protein [Myxococcales bacterium]
MRKAVFYRAAARPAPAAGAVGCCPLLGAVAVIAGTLAIAPPARADDTIKRPGDHPMYPVEIEPHALFGWGGVYGGSGGYGIGARFAIPVVRNGFIPNINNSVAVSFGIDWVHYDFCWFRGNCSANYFDLPATMQWNFFVARRWSVFGEPGFMLFFSSFGDCPPGTVCPNRPAATGVQPAFFLGGRFHLSDNAALTMRVGYPTFSIGVSFFP